jgi:peptidoglycan/LPS O-acetylase OafA/YrhL
MNERALPGSNWGASVTAGRRFFPEVESLRGLAALGVVVFHALQSQATPGHALIERAGLLQAVLISAGQLITNGGALVILFFVISGFVMGANVDPAQSLLGFYPRFLVRRFFRLWPMIVFAVLFAAALTRFIDHQPIGSLLSELTLSTIRLDPPLWSLQVEAVVCLVYPLALFVVLRARPVTQIVLLLGVTVFNPMPFYFSFASNYVVAFAFGVFVPILGRNFIKELRPAWARYGLFAAIALFYAMTAVWLVPFWPMRGNVIITSIAFCGAYFVAFIAFSPDGVPWLRHPAMRFLGRISYSLYVLHYPIMSIVVRHIAITYVPSPVMLDEAVSLAITLTICLPLAAFCYRFIETPFIRLGHALSARMAAWAKPEAVVGPVER